MTLKLLSTEFNDGDGVPTKFTCEGDDVSPPLKWTNPPLDTKSFAIILEDPEDATAPGGVFTHWTIFNIPSDTMELAENFSAKGKVPKGAKEGKNDFEKIGYGGPCPDGSGKHKYRFTIYSLDQKLSLGSGISKTKLLESIQGHIIDQAELRGIY
ncbi:YbhB/YbcL family Raf kinase inhibitor-like protein [Thermodesulfobacteriota bacterium]